MTTENKWIVNGKGKNARVLPIIDNIPGDNFLEVMAGANKWHQVSKEVFLSAFLSEGKHDGILSIIENMGQAESYLHVGWEVVMNHEEARSATTRIGKALYEEYQKKVNEIGGGDVSEYAKKVSGKTRAELWGF